MSPETFLIAVFACLFILALWMFAFFRLASRYLAQANHHLANLDDRLDAINGRLRELKAVELKAAELAALNEFIREEQQRLEVSER